MSKQASLDRISARLIRALIEDPQVRLRKTGADEFMLAGSKIARPRTICSAIVADLLARGLLVRDGEAFYRASTVARSWLVRRKTQDMTFKAQHGELEVSTAPGGKGRHTVLINRNESPVGQLARRRDRSGKPLLQPYQVAAAERLRAKFERGHLQPSITANWSTTVSPRRRSGGSGGAADMTDAALAARTRIDRAIAGVGPEFSGILIDACCFLKGLETIERERLWPARSAKLVLQLALAALAHHYGLGETAAGAARSKAILSWGADGYRPEIS
jgi:hypothetical protein